MFLLAISLFLCFGSLCYIATTIYLVCNVVLQSIQQVICFVLLVVLLCSLLLSNTFLHFDSRLMLLPTSLLLFLQSSAYCCQYNFCNSLLFISSNLLYKCLLSLVSSFVSTNTTTSSITIILSSLYRSLIQKDKIVYYLVVQLL